MAREGVLTLDQGTTSSRAIVFDQEGGVLALSQREFPQIYPQPGWVEHDPEAIWASVLATAREALEQAARKRVRVRGVGLTNQRETAIIWERATGRPIHNAIVWQDRRTAARCEEITGEGAGEVVAEKTGLVMDPYFSATKFDWILNKVDGAREAAIRGELAFGTVDSFLIWRLTGGASHVTDATNASRTSLFDLRASQWDEGLLELFRVPAAGLPEVKDCADDFGETRKDLLGVALPIRGVAGDQQAAAIGQACTRAGEMKSTYGTGAFLLVNTGKEMTRSQSRLLSTVAYRLGGETAFALEGSILSAGSTVQWLRDGLGLVSDAAETEALAAGADPDSGVYLVPAFTGLGAPWWDADARGALVGLTRGTGRAEIALAALDAAAHQTCDILDAVDSDGVAVSQLRVDGGMARNDLFLKRLAALSGESVLRPEQTEATAWGAAFLAWLGLGEFGSIEEIGRLGRDARFDPDMAVEQRARLRSGWAEAIGRVRSR
jgi:glycerol kinase